MRVNIDKLTEAELVDLNHRIVERLRFLNQARAHARMLQFVSDVEVTNVSAHGFWLLVRDRELFLPFAQFPWFKEDLGRASARR